MLWKKEKSVPTQHAELQTELVRISVRVAGTISGKIRKL
jgi:hypothetical protein